MSDLIERVASALRELESTDPTFHTDARAAIAAVAEWLGENGKPYEAAALRAAAGGGEK